MTASNPDKPTPLVDIVTIATLLGTSERHIRRLVAERRIPYVKVGHLLRFDPVEVRAWLEANRPGGASRRAAG